MSKKTTKKLIKDSYLSSEEQRTLEQRRIDYFENGLGTPTDKMASLQRFMSRQNCAKFMAQHEMMRLTRNTLGDIIEAGVYFGGGFMTWALMATALEPFNYQCQVLGFDTFEGSTGLTEVDFKNPHFKRREGEYYAPSYEDLQEAVRILDMDRPLAHLPKALLIKGDIRKTAPQYVAEHPELAVRILHIGMNLYAPTLETLKAFLPRMSKGGIVAIDGLNYATGGCMEALREVTGKNNLELKVFDYYPNFTYYIV